MNWLIAQSEGSEASGTNEPTVLLMNHDASQGRSLVSHWRALSLAYFFQELGYRHRRHTNQIDVRCRS